MASKIKYEMEFPIHSSPKLLYQYIATPSGLAEWFADNVNFREDVYTFFWGDSEEKARLLTRQNGQKIRFKWLEDTDEDTYFELYIQLDELTKDVSLMVTDFANEDELEEAKMLWENQVSELKHIIGSV